MNSKDPTVTALPSCDGHSHRGLHHYEGLNCTPCPSRAHKSGIGSSIRLNPRAQLEREGVALVLPGIEVGSGCGADG